MKRKKKNHNTRNIYIPTTILYVLFMPWVELHSVEFGDSLSLQLYNEADDGANLQISGLADEVDALMEFLQDEIACADTELIELGYIKM